MSMKAMITLSLDLPTRGFVTPWTSARCGSWLHKSLPKWMWVKYVGGVTLKNSLVLLLRDPHQLDGNPWGWSWAWQSRTWRCLGNPLDHGLGCFLKCINLLLKLVLAFLLVVLWWKVILCLFHIGSSRIILLLLRNKLWCGVLTFFPLNSFGVELSFKTNSLILSVPSLLADNFLKALTPGKALLDTFLYNSFQ